MQHALTLEFFEQEILRLKILAQDCFSDYDISAVSDSNFDILESIDKADFVKFWDDDCSMLAGFEEKLNT